MGDKTDRLEAELAEFRQKFAVDFRAARAGLDQVHDEIFAFDQVRPDLVLLRRRVSHDRRAADTGEITAFLAEDFHSDDIALLQLAVRRADVGELATLAAGDNHELVALGAAGEK